MDHESHLKKFNKLGGVIFSTLSWIGDMNIYVYHIRYVWIHQILSKKNRLIHKGFDAFHLKKDDSSFISMFWCPFRVQAVP